MSLTVSYCCMLSSLSLRSHGDAVCLSQSPIVAVCPSLSIPVPCSCCMSLSPMAAEFAVSHCLSGPMVLLYVSQCLPFLLAVSHCLSGPMELLQVSHCLLWLLAISNCLSGPIELLAVSHCLPWLLAFSHCLFQCHRVAACLSLSPIVAALAVSHSLFGPMELLHVSHCLSPILLLAVSHCLSSPMEFLQVSQCLLCLLAVSHCLLCGCWLSLTVTYIVAGCLSLSHI